MAFKNNPLLRARPLMIVGALMLLLMLAWLPTGDMDAEQRSHKPLLWIVDNTASDSDALVLNVRDDLQQRLSQRHEWRLAKQPEPHVWQLTLQVFVDSSQQPDQLRLEGELQAPHQGELKRFAIEGKTDVAGLLPEQYVKIATQLLTSATETAE
ncbi:hypothetical protein [Pseudidiomarina mangrovi]|uniref:hypothetical protein n=1 Tax=Pseudidiomarina mangrovi TaxID=2487133 RepID=UPI000FCC930D|nr:hypothetical protein [Pseudidiomarina mangrovi]